LDIGANAQAVMLLTVSLGKSDKSGPKPLTTKEWARFAVWLKDHELKPSALLSGDVNTLLAGWMDKTVTTDRISGLLDRGGVLGLVLEKWRRAGLWVLTRSDSEYPERLKHRLRFDSPPVLFGCGNKKLLGRGGIAVVGSRDAATADVAFSENLGGSAAEQGYSIVSGGARGVDESAMFGALKNGGTAVGVLADSMLRAASSARYRKHLLAGDLVLVTPFNPEAGFNVGNAMARNRHIYCLADAAVVVSSTPNKGGTWNGAIDDLKAGWVPLWVKRTNTAGSGNSELVQKGANWFPDDLDSLSTLLTSPSTGAVQGGGAELPLLSTQVTPVELSEGVVGKSKTEDESVLHPIVEIEKVAAGQDNKPVKTDADFYRLFLDRVIEVTDGRPMKADEIAASLELEKSQVNAWLKRGVADGEIKKLQRPVRYQANTSEREQASLFG